MVRTYLTSWLEMKTFALKNVPILNEEQTETGGRGKNKTFRSHNWNNWPKLFPLFSQTDRQPIFANFFSRLCLFPSSFRAKEANYKTSDFRIREEESALRLTLKFWNILTRGANSRENIFPRPNKSHTTKTWCTQINVWFSLSFCTQKEYGK